ncbi:MAG TPA: DUF3971 domain-containing protein [Beijerinckiaceae bacterium]|nr:DUF3971 domain-containing protein [Beijerinckiaceae bacterium]
MAAIVVGMLYFNLERHPLVGQYLRDKLVRVLEERMGAAFKVGLDAVDLRREQAQTTIKVTGFHLRHADGRRIIDAPEGVITLDSARLVLLALVPTRIELSGLSVVLELSETGQLGLGEDESAGVVAAPAVQPKAPEMDAAGPIDRLRTWIGATFASLSATREALGGTFPQLGIREATFAIQDRRNGQKFSLSGIRADLSTADSSAVLARTEVRMGQTAFAVDLELSPPGEATQRLRVRSERFDAGDILALSGLMAAGVDGRTEVDFLLDAEVDQSRQAVSARAEVSFGRTALNLNASEPPLVLDRSRAVLNWTQQAPGITIESLDITSGAVALKLAGTITPPAAPAGDWSGRLSAAEPRFDGLAQADEVIQLSSLDLDLAYSPATGALRVENLKAIGPKANVTAAVQIAPDASGQPSVKVDVAATDTDARAALRLWPRFFAPETRRWLADHVHGGLLTDLVLAVHVPGDVLAAAAARPLPEEAVSARWKLTGTVLQALPDTPLIRDVNSTGRATGRSVRVDIEKGMINTGGRKLMLHASQFAIADTWAKVPEALIRARFSGSADALADLARAPGLQPFVPRPIDPARIKGQAEGEVTLALKLNDRPQAGDVRIGMNAILKDVSVDTGYAGRALEGGPLQLTVERETILLKGDARLGGIPAQVEVRGSGKAPPMATLNLTIDDAARARLGMSAGALLTGPILARLTVPLHEDGKGNDGKSNDGKSEVAAEFDLARAGIGEIVPGWSKKAGTPGKARAVLAERPGGAWSLSKFELDAGTLSLRGAVDLARDGTFQKASFSSFKLSPGDNVQVDAERSGAITRIAVRGNAFDARPFLKATQTGSIDKANARDTELTLKTTVMSGFGSELVANADLRMEKRGNDLKRFDLSGRFDGGPVTVKLQPQAGAPTLVVESGDAGAFLRFFDLYARMRGGNLILSAALGEGSQRGTILVRDFSLRDEPALKRLVTDQTATASTGGDSTRLPPEVLRRLGQTKDVPFTKMNVTFARTPGRLDVQDAVVWGPEIGGSMNGSLDYLRDRVSLTGTFVPAFSLNNMFAQVPVLGPLLGGGRNEGLFAVRYTISGQLSAPTLTIDPLTAIAPGFLRKIIDFRGHAQQREKAGPQQ